MGAVAGLGFWIHPMFVAAIAPLVVIVFVIHRRRIVDVWLPAIGGAVVGCGPLILWNAVNGWPSLTDQPETPGTYTERFRAIVTDLFPRAFGLKDAQLDWRFGTAIGLVLYVAIIAAHRGRRGGDVAPRGQPVQARAHHACGDGPADGRAAAVDLPRRRPLRGHRVSVHRRGDRCRRR